jgi:hypothetical protein
LASNERLAAIRSKAPEWEDKIKQWSQAQSLIVDRLPRWQLVESLTRHARSIDAAKPHLDQVEAVRAQRMLLDKSDPVSGIRVALADLLRKAIQASFVAHQDAYGKGLLSLERNDDWKQVSKSDREAILAAVGLKPPASADVATDEALAACLDQRPLAGTQAEIDAIPGRLAQARERAARLLLPKVQTITLERATLRDKTEVEAWIERQKVTLLTAVANGPVLVS